MTLNRELLQRTLDYIEAHPDEHDQADWMNPGNETCNTTKCFAGWAVTLEGGEWIEGSSSLLKPEINDPSQDIMRAYWDWRQDRIVNAGAVPVFNRARRLLGLTEDQSYELFEGSQSLSEVRDVVQRLLSDA